MAHLIGHIKGVSIEHADHLCAAMIDIADICGFNIVAKAFHQFEPVGATGVLVLAESHFSAHTYPEEELVYIDVFCCSKDFSPEACAKIIEREFQATSATWQVVQRR